MAPTMTNESICDRVHRRYAFVATVCLLLLASFGTGPVAGASLPDVIDQLRPSVVGVGTAYPPRQPNRKGPAVSYRGTGFVVGDGSHVITNAHVLPEKLDSENKQSLVIFSGRGAQATATPVQVVRTDKEHDLALLKFQGKTLPALRLGDGGAVREGQQIAFTGFPMGMVLGLYPVTHRGIVSVIAPVARPAEDSRTISPAQMRRLRNPFDVFQLDATAYPGNSGSPVYLPDSGEVIGVINSVAVKESRESILQKPSGISYAIPVKYVRALLQGE